MDRVEQQSQTTEFKITWKDATTYASLDGGTDTLKMCTRKGKKKITDWKKPKTFLLPNFVKDASKVSEFILGR